MKNKKIIICLILLFIIIIVVLGIYLFNRNKRKFLDEYIENALTADYIMHALGGMEGTYSYTNSIDALKQTYEEGYRFFEVDISLTLDQKLVCAHSTNNGILGDDEMNIWSKNDWIKRLGQKYDENHTLATYEEFMSFEIQGKFKATSFEEIVDFMSKHKDMYIMLDIGNRSYKSTKKIYQAIVDSAKGNEDVLNRMIAGGHTTEMIEAVLEVYDFPLLNLYFADEETRQEELQDPKDFVDYCTKNGITSFSTSVSTFKNEDLSELINSELISYVFTTDEEEEAAMIREKGGIVVGTNFLRN